MNNSSNARLSLARSIGVCLVILALAWGGAFLIRSCVHETRKAVNDAIGNIKEAFVEAFHLTPEISYHNKIIVNQTSPITELAVVTKEFNCETHYTNTRFRSEKTLDLQATFRVKAGFDLHESFRVTIECHPPKAYITLPQPKILSCEMISEDIVDQSNGVVNWLGPEDHKAALAQITKEARQQAERSKLREEAKAEVEKQLKALLGDKVASIAFEPGAINLQPAKHD
jgi:hypothetical protein